jgi:hypothetical protein
MKYLPFVTGTYSTAPGLIPLGKKGHREALEVFDFDDQYEKYCTNKRECRKENIRKYYIEHQFKQETYLQVIAFIISQLRNFCHEQFRFSKKINHSGILLNKLNGEEIEWDSSFNLINNNKYLSLLDAVCSQLQEDIAVCQLSNEDNKIVALHLCAPNCWSPGEKIGGTFNEIHEPVPGMQKVMDNHGKMLQLLINNGPFTRFAWGISTDDRLNHHPSAPKGFKGKDWFGRKISPSTKLFVRTEKQNMIGFPAINAFLFTIRTYFYDIEELTPTEKKMLYYAVEDMSPESRIYKGVNGKEEILKARLMANGNG